MVSQNVRVFPASRPTLLAIAVLFACCISENLLAEPVRLALDAFGTVAEVEVRGLPRELARDAASAALDEIFQTESLLDPDGDTPGGIGQLNASAGVVAVDPRAREAVLRALQFCIWSSGAYGPLGGEVNRLWPILPGGTADSSRPELSALRMAVGSAECSRVQLLEEPEIRLAAGSRLDSFGIARGVAVDRAVEVLQKRGVENAWVEIGRVRRALGPGHDGNGWFVTLPPAPGKSEPLDRLWLVDQAMVILSIDQPYDDPFRPIVDQRTGVPASGVVGVVAVSDLAADAEPLATVLYILGHREGQQRLGNLSPRPAVYWMLGESDNTALEATYHWSDLRRLRQR